MTSIVFTYTNGAQAAPPVMVAARRRLSAVMRDVMKDSRRPYIVSVHREGDGLLIKEGPGWDGGTIRLRRDWKRVVLGKKSVVRVTYIGAGGGGGNAAGIGAAVATIALMVVAPYLAPLIVGGLGITAAAGFAASTVSLATSLVSAGIVVGGSMLISSMTRQKQKKQMSDTRPIYGVSGSGIAARAGDRIPYLFGKCWGGEVFQAFSEYQGEDQIISQLVMVAANKVNVHQIRAGSSTLWTQAGGVQAPFTGAEVEIITPGQPSALIPSDVASSPDVGGALIPSNSGSPSFQGPFLIPPNPGQTTNRIQLDFSAPQGIGAVSSIAKYSGKTFPAGYNIQFEYRPVNPVSGAPIGGWSLLHYHGGSAQSDRALRYTEFKDVAAGRYEVRATDYGDKGDGIRNSFNWDGLRAILPGTRTWPYSVIAIKVRSGAALGITNISDILVEATSVLPVRSALGVWSDQETREAIWAACYVRRDTRDGLLSTSVVDGAYATSIANSTLPYREFNGVVKGPVSQWDALSTILLPLRASPGYQQGVLTFCLDMPQATPKAIFTGVDTVAGTSAMSFDLAADDGRCHRIIEFDNEGDPKRPNEAEAIEGAAADTPIRIKMPGVTSYDHAAYVARWMAKAALLRRPDFTKRVLAEGRLLAPGDKVKMTFDAIEGAVSHVVLAASGRSFTLAGEAFPASEVMANQRFWVRDAGGRGMGPFTIESLSGDRRTVTIPLTEATSFQTTYGYPVASLYRDNGRAVSAAICPVSKRIYDVIVRSVRPGDNGEVTIDGVYDHPDFWTGMGVSLPPQDALPNDPFRTPGLMVAPSISARVSQRLAALELVWSIRPLRGASSYEVQASYDGWTSSETIYLGEALTGVYPARVSDTVIYVRARAHAGEGWGEWGYTTCQPPSYIDIPTDLMVSAENLEYTAARLLDTGSNAVDLGLQTLAAAFDAAFAQRTANSAIRRADIVEDTADRALAATRIELEANFGSAQALTAQQLASLSTAQAALASSLTTLDTEFDSYSASVNAQLAAFSSADLAFASDITALEARFTGSGPSETLASVKTVAETAADDAAAAASTAATALAQVDDVTANGQLKIEAASDGTTSNALIKFLVSASSGAATTEAGIVLRAIASGAQAVGSVDLRGDLVRILRPDGSVLASFNATTDRLTLDGELVSNDSIFDNIIVPLTADYTNTNIGFPSAFATFFSTTYTNASGKTQIVEYGCRVIVEQLWGPPPPAYGTARAFLWLAEDGNANIEIYDYFFDLNTGGSRPAPTGARFFASNLIQTYRSRSGLRRLAPGESMTVSVVGYMQSNSSTTLSYNKLLAGSELYIIANTVG